MFASRYLPCPDCGASLELTERSRHACERERWLDFQLFQIRYEIDLFAAELSAYLSSPRGRFEVWDAARKRER